MVGSSPERARAKAETAVLPEPYESFEAMLADPRVDVVHITSPNKLHLPQARAALEAGKHVVCEKPLAMTASETARAARAGPRERARARRQLQHPLLPAVPAGARAVAAGALGPVHLVTGGYLQDWLLLDTDWNWRLDPAEGGELRAVGDIGSHWIDLVAVRHRPARRGGDGRPRHVRRPCASSRSARSRRSPAAAAGETVPREMETEDPRGCCCAWRAARAP